MPDLIDKAQLHATAQVAKSYILEQDTANVSTIINALQSGGGSAKTVPTLTLGGWSSADSIYSAALTYNGDGNLSTSTGTISNGTLTVNDADGNFSGTVSAAEGTNYAPASLVFNYNSSSTPAPAGKTEGVITCDNNFVSTNETTATVNVSYNGDGTLKGFTAPWDLDAASSQYEPITIEGGVATLKYLISGAGDDYFVGMFYAQATDNYTAAVCPFRVVR